MADRDAEKKILIFKRETVLKAVGWLAAIAIGLVGLRAIKIDAPIPA